MEAQLKISVVVATYNRSETLKMTLRNLAAQSLAPDNYEVIVVDDGSPDDTQKVVARAQIEAPFRLRYSRHENHGCGFTQNRGIREALAPIVLLIADDIWLVPNALESHIAGHAAHWEPEAAVLGCVLQSTVADETLFLRTWDPFKFRQLRDGIELPYYMFWACNISFKRDFMACHGMFREHKGRAGYSAHEDVELGYRLHGHGLRIFYSPKALGYHHHVTTLESEMKRAYSRGLNWDEFKQYVPVPEIDVKYHVFRFNNLIDYVRVFFGPRRQYLLGADRNWALLAVRQLLRVIAFNRPTIGCWWLPLFRGAERWKPLARLVSSSSYNGVISYWFYRGCREGRRVFGPTPKKGCMKA